MTERVVGEDDIGPIFAEVGDRDDGGSAFPLNIAGYSLEEHPGMSLRDWFAGQAISGFNQEMVRYEWGENVLGKAAEMAYRVADAMLEARKR